MATNYVFGQGAPGVGLLHITHGTRKVGRLTAHDTACGGVVPKGWNETTDPGKTPVCPLCLKVAAGKAQPMAVPQIAKPIAAPAPKLGKRA